MTRILKLLSITNFLTYSAIENNPYDLYKKTMRVKKNIIGWVLIAIGCLLIIFERHVMHKISDAKSFAQSFTNFFTNSSGEWNPLVSFFGGKVQEQISKHDSIVVALFTSGIIFIVGGLMVLLQNRS